ncbi:MAG: radical SAM protein [Magnetococcales bacterium]|nr:radical SAM protein [Magnetococcales bacterium]
MTVLYSSMKFLRFTDHLQAIQEQRVVAPVHICIKPTNRCNHDCWYCSYKVSNLQLGTDMVEEDSIPADKMDEIVSDIIAMGVKAVTFSGGGEPLLYKPLPDVVRRLANGGVKVATLTNGINLKGRMADAFADCGTWVRISIDAWDDVSYCQARGLKGTPFSQVVENVRHFTGRNGSCVLGISYIITQDNYEHIYDVSLMFRELGVNHVKLSGVVVSDDGAGNNDYHHSIMPRVKEEIQRAQALNNDSFSVVDHYHELEERFDKQYTFCPFLQFLTVIGADCGVYVCHDKAYTDSGLLGSIKECDFRSFWFSEENRRRIYALDPSQQCHHHCVTHARNLAILEYLSIEPEHGLFV